MKHRRVGGMTVAAVAAVVVVLYATGVVGECLVPKYQPLRCSADEPGSISVARASSCFPCRGFEMRDSKRRSLCLNNLHLLKPF